MTTHSGILAPGKFHGQKSLMGYEKSQRVGVTKGKTKYFFK